MDDGLVIDAKRLGKRFGSHRALSEIDLTVHRGEIVGLVGPDGAGKTTLLQLLAAILDPTEGQSKVLGFDTVRQAHEVTSRIGYMAQGFTLYGRLTVDENIRFAARIRDVPASLFERRRDRLLTMAGLGPFKRRREDRLSGGMRKKLALCANLVHEPPVLLLDEPGLGVDPMSRRELWSMLASFRAEGTTIVVTTSYMDEVERCDRVMFLDAGRSIAFDRPERLRNEHAGAVYRVNTADPDTVELTLRAGRGVLSAERRDTGIRLVVDPMVADISHLRALIADQGELEEAEPMLEDVFILMGRGSRSGEAALTGARPSDARRRPEGAPIADGVSIAIHNLTRRFGNFVAVDHVSLDVRAGEVLGLLGANGAGKTTLIRMMCGLLPPSDGEIKVAGVDAVRNSRELSRHIGYMSQRFSLYLDLTVDENLTFFASAYGLRGATAADAIEEAVRSAGLDAFRDSIVERLSGAVRQRLALSCSTLHHPAVVFLDEPSSGVDPLSRARFWRLIQSRATSGSALVVSTHYMDEAAFCSRLALMHQGRIVALGTQAQLREALSMKSGASMEEVFAAHIEHERARDGDLQRAVA